MAKKLFKVIVVIMGILLIIAVIYEATVPTICFISFKKGVSQDEAKIVLGEDIKEVISRFPNDKNKKIILQFYDMPRVKAVLLKNKYEKNPLVELMDIEGFDTKRLPLKYIFNF